MKKAMCLGFLAVFFFNGVIFGGGPAAGLHGKFVGKWRGDWVNEEIPGAKSESTLEIGQDGGCVYTWEKQPAFKMDRAGKVNPECVFLSEEKMYFKNPKGKTFVFALNTPEGKILGIIEGTGYQAEFSASPY